MTEAAFLALLEAVLIESPHLISAVMDIVDRNRSAAGPLVGHLQRS